MDVVAVSQAVAGLLASEAARELDRLAAEQGGAGSVAQRAGAGRDVYTAGRDQTVVWYRPGR